MTKYLFGDLVRNCKEKVDRDNNPYEYFVAGDHMETERPKLTMRGRFDESDVGPAFIRMFKPGQVLYGSRRTYLKKVSVADFEGVTSNVTFVLETKDESILPQTLLPFLLLSDRFTSYSIGKSKGSTNPYVLFSDLADFEIDLPEPKTVAEIADIMCAAERLKENYRSLIATCDDVVKSQFVEMFGDPVENPKGWETSSLTSLGSCKNGMNFKSKESGIELPCLGVGDFKDRSVINDVSEMGRINLDDEPAEGFFLKDGDIVFVRSNGNKELVGRCLAVYPHGEKAVFSGFCIRLRVESDKVRIPYLIWALKQPSMRQQMFGRGANVQNLNQKLMAKVDVPIPPLAEQDRFLALVSIVDKSKFAVQKALNELNATTKKILNQELGLGDV